MKSHPDVSGAFRKELYDWRLWMTRGIVLAFAALAGLTVVGFTWLCEQALAHFHLMRGWQWQLPLVWAPLSTAAIVWLTRR